MSDDYRSDERGQGQGRGGRYFFSRPKTCAFCADKNLVINYKHVEILRRYVTEDGRIRPRRQTGACAKHQRALAGAIKQARHIALLPFSSDLDEGRS
ncbi:MAG: 30S ribosomal protein S18 [Chloroflexota bacterium]